MAILENQPGLEVRILVAGRQLEEYTDGEHPATTTKVVKFVKATSGQVFEIWYHFARSFSTEMPVSVKITVDGEAVDEPLHFPNRLFDPKGYISSGALSNESGDEWVVQKYKFSELSIDDDDRTICDELLDEYAAIGTIKVEFWFCKTPKLERHPEVAPKLLEKKEDVPEKAVKAQAVSHQATLREPEATLDLDYYHAEYADEAPFATFFFFYRSLESLKDLHIIPRTPTPEPHFVCAVDTMSTRQVRRALRRLLKQNTAAAGTKRERADDEDGSGSVEGSTDLEVTVTGAKRVKSFPRPGQEVIELD